MIGSVASVIPDGTGAQGGYLSVSGMCVKDFEKTYGQGI